MRFLPYVVIAVVLLGLLVWSRRAKQRSADSDARMRRDITVGTQVMTTSGLYGTVIAVNPDDTVILAIAPGVEVRWAFAALRDVDALPPRYRRPPSGETGGYPGGNPAANQSARLDGTDDGG